MILTSTTERRAALIFIGKLYKANRSNIENRRILKKCARWSMLITKIYAVAFVTTLLICISLPLTIFVITGKMEPILPTKYPFIPTDVFWGYATHSIICIIVAFTVYCGIIGSESLILTSTMHIWAMLEILKNTVTGLNLACRGLQNEAVKNSTWLHRRVRNIVLMHRDIYL